MRVAQWVRQDSNLRRAPCKSAVMTARPRTRFLWTRAVRSTRAPLISAAMALPWTRWDVGRRRRRLRNVLKAAVVAATSSDGAPDEHPRPLGRRDREPA